MMVSDSGFPARVCYGVQAFPGGTHRETLIEALEQAHQHQGLSVVHLPVYFGPHEMGNLGAWGQWNVGNWCQEVQKEHQRLGL